MAYSESKHKRKLLRRAVELKKESTKSYRIMGVLAVLCLIAIVIYFVLIFKGVIANNPAEQVICIIVAIGIGTLSVRATRNSRRYEDYLREFNLTKAEVKEFMRESKKN